MSNDWLDEDPGETPLSPGDVKFLKAHARAYDKQLQDAYAAGMSGGDAWAGWNADEIDAYRAGQDEAGQVRRTQKADRFKSRDAKVVTRGRDQKAPPDRKQAWLGAFMVAAAIGYILFAWATYPHHHPAPPAVPSTVGVWQPYTGGCTASQLALQDLPPGWSCVNGHIVAP